MGKEIIRWGIIGCGDVAEIKSGPAFQRSLRSELLAVMRRDRHKAEDFAKRHKVPSWYDDADRLLANEEINAVYIATPPSSHVEYALKSIQAGKNIYLEKPVALSSAEGTIIKEALQGKSNKLVVAHYRRKMEAFIKVKELLDAKAIGRVRLVDIQILQPAQTDLIAQTNENWRVIPEVSGGGYFYDLAPHQLDLMMTYFGKPERMAGFSMNQQKKYPADDMVNGLIHFKNGVQFRGVWAFNVAENDKKDVCTIYGDIGSISFSFYGNEVVLENADAKRTFEFPSLPHIQQPMIEATVNYFLGEEENPCPIEDAILGMEIMEAFTR